MKHNRLFGIIYLLLANKMMTAQELADYFEVSPRTIYRDIETLSELKIPVYMSKGKNGGIGLLDDYKFDKAVLTKEEYDTILFSLDGISKLQIKDTSNLEKIFAKKDESWFEVDFSIWDKSSRHKEFFLLLKEAIINKREVEFSYFGSNGKNTNRKVEPLKLYFRHNAWYLCGYDVNKKDYRFFKIMRIKNLKILSETFERVFEYKEDLVDKKPDIIKLVLEIDKSLAYRVYDEFDESNIRYNEEGNFVVTVEFPYSSWIYGFVLSFGADIKVLEPLYFREEIKAILEKSLDNYL